MLEWERSKELPDPRVRPVAQPSCPGSIWRARSVARREESAADLRGFVRI